MFHYRNTAFITIFVIAGLLISGCDSAASPTQSSIEDPGLALVKRFNMGAGLVTLANKVAHRTTTFRMIAEEHGRSDATALVKAEISRLLPQYQQRWNRTLASIYSKHLSDEVLRSLATQGANSPYIDKLKASVHTVGAEMKSKASPLLKELVTKALKRAMNK